MLLVLICVSNQQNRYYYHGKTVKFQPNNWYSNRMGAQNTIEYHKWWTGYTHRI